MRILYPDIDIPSHPVSLSLPTTIAAHIHISGPFHTPQLTFLLDDVGIPKSYRFMPGFGVHTFRMLNKAGKETFVKFHWIPKQGKEVVRMRRMGKTFICRERDDQCRI